MRPSALKRNTLFFQRVVLQYAAWKLLRRGFSAKSPNMREAGFFPRTISVNLAILALLVSRWGVWFRRELFADWREGFMLIRNPTR
jgi:hypothetical protein